MTFNLDIFLKTIIESLFLTTVKGLTASNIILMSFIGIGASICLSPLIFLISKKIGNKASLVLASLCSVSSVILYIVCTKLIGFIIAYIIYNLIAILYQPADIILKNNLKAVNKEADFVKWSTYGKLGFSAVTLVISLFSGIWFNINPYLPMFISLGCAILGLIFALLFQETKTENLENLANSHKEKLSYKSVFSNKIMVLILLMNLSGLGIITFYQSRASLLIQLTCENFAIELAKISIIISVVDFLSRIVRILSNTLFPHIYKKIQDKSILLKYVSMAILLACFLMSIGGILQVSLELNIALIGLGALMCVSIRDIYGTLENKAILTHIPSDQQNQAMILNGVYKKIGRLTSNLIALILLNFVSLNYAYCLLLPLSIVQIVICFKLSKFVHK